MADRKPETARDAVIRLREQGLSWSQCAEAMRKSHPDDFGRLSDDQAYTKCRNLFRREPAQASTRWQKGQSGYASNTWQPGQSGNPAGRPVVYHDAPVRQTPEPDSLMRLLERGMDLAGIAERLGVSERVASAMVDDLREGGYNIREIDGFFQISKILPVQENRVKETWKGEKVIRFGLTGDCHINSKYTQLTFLHELYDLYAREGIGTVYHTGDLDEGERMRPGHQYECYTQGADDHIAEIARVYPKRNGITTKYILGNHDHAFIKHVGLDIGPQISGLRDDMVYIGQSAAVVELTDGCTLELRHPWDGSAYALSYKPQKMIDAMSGGEKPSILAIGNYHKAEYLFYRNIHVFQSATTQAQTPWMRSKQISAHLGGWLVEVHVNDDGSIRRVRNEFIPCYKAVKDDYLNWR